MSGVPPPRGPPDHAAAPADRTQLRHRRREPDRQLPRLHPLLEEQVQNKPALKVLHLHESSSQVR